MPKRIDLWRTTPVRLAVVFSLIFAAAACIAAVWQAGTSVSAGPLAHPS